MKFTAILKNIAYEGFRPHSKAEYAELFTRGGKSQSCARYPWFYARVWLVCLAAFAISVIGYSVSALNASTVIAVGATFGNIGLIVLFFELYPDRDLSLITLLAVVLLGGVAAGGVSQALYAAKSYYMVPYVAQAWTAFVEEISKAVVTVIMLVILKRRNPFFCFLIGAAVGTGYSMFEDMWYIYTDAVGFATLFVHSAVLQAVVRSFGAPFSHAAWAAAFGWAISFKKPWTNFRPYAVFAGNMALHFFINFPLIGTFSGWRGYPISIVCGLIALAFEIYLIIKLRRYHNAADGETAESVPPEINGESDTVSKGLCANVVFAVALTLALSFVFAASWLYRGNSNYTYVTFDDWQTCVEYVQNGEVFTPDFDREVIYYNDDTEIFNRNYSVTVREGRIVEVTQRQRYGLFNYRFRYGYVQHIVIDDKTGDVNTETVWELISVGVEYFGSLYLSTAINVEGYGRVRMFIVNEAVAYVYSDSQNRPVVAFNNPHREGIVPAVAFITAAGGVLIAGTAGYFIIKKTRRNKNA